MSAHDSMTHRRFNGVRASRHVILRQLGHGNLTRVFLAAPRSTPTGEPVVIKLMHQELAKDDDLRALFLDQAATTLTLRHPNLVRTLDVIADGDACGLTMEFLRGQTLARVLERVGRQRFPVDLHLHILSKVLDALAYAHAYAGGGHPAPGFMHGDVCPNNVFITHDGRIKLLGTGFGDSMQALETRLGRPLRDVRYAAPEVLLGYPSGPRSDLFGVGVMVWEAVTRQARVSSDDANAVIRRRTRGEEPDLESTWADAPEPMIELCSRALAVSPRERHATARALAAQLAAYLGRAAESSDAVLARLPELMEASFGPEREQMQLFLGARLDRVDADASNANVGPGDGEDELTPQEEDWTAATSTRAPLADRDALEPGPNDGVRTGLRRARPEPVAPRATTGVHERGRPSAGPLPAPAPSPAAGTRAPVPAPEWASRASRRLEPVSGPAPADPIARFEPLFPMAPEPPRSEATTSGHRAYSASLDSAPRSRRGKFRVSADVLGAAALLAGSLVATYSIYRHAQRNDKPESQTLAMQADGRDAPRASARPAPASPLPPVEVAPTASPAATRVTGVAASGPSALESAPTVALPTSARPASTNAPDGGAASSEIPAATSAFFDGQVAPSERRAPPQLRAEELPAVDPELRSLQEAIVTAAKAQRPSQKHRREKKAESRLQPAPMLPRPIDDTDPYAEPSPP